MCCSGLQYLAVSCSVLKCVAVCCSMLQCVAVCGCVWLCVAVREQVPDDMEPWSLFKVPTHIYTQHTTKHWNTLQHTMHHTATHYNTQQHTATHCWSFFPFASENRCKMTWILCRHWYPATYIHLAQCKTRKQTANTLNTLHLMNTYVLIYTYVYTAEHYIHWYMYTNILQKTKINWEHTEHIAPYTCFVYIYIYIYIYTYIYIYIYIYKYILRTGTRWHGPFVARHDPTTPWL